MNLTRVMTIKKLYGISMLQFEILKVLIAAGITYGLFRLAQSYSPIDLLVGGGIPVGILILIGVYLLSLSIIALKKSDARKLEAKFFKK